MLKLRTYQKAITKDLEIEKYTCEHFCFDYKMGKYQIKRTLLPSKTNVNSSVKKTVLVSKRLIQFLNKATFSSFVHDKGQEIYILLCSRKCKLNITLIALILKLLTPIFEGFSGQKLFYKHNFCVPILQSENTKWHSNRDLR